MKVKAEWVRRFKQEATDHLEAAEPLLVRLEGSGELEETLKAETLRQLFIKAHNIKGTASMIALNEVATAAAALETRWGEAWLEPARYDLSSQKQARQELSGLAGLVAAIEVPAKLE